MRASKQVLHQAWDTGKQVLHQAWDTDKLRAHQWDTGKLRAYNVVLIGMLQQEVELLQRVEAQWVSDVDNAEGGVRVVEAQGALHIWSMLGFCGCKMLLAMRIE